MVEGEPVRVAARNNAEWCDAFCRAHGVAGHFDGDAWWAAERTPPFYPDAVTLRRGVDAGGLLARIDGRGGCSIKDSFADLDLKADGFDVLFRADWLRLEAARAPAAAAGWSSVRTAEELANWETAWGEAPQPGPFFRAALLAEESVTILVRHGADGIVAGAVANRSPTAIGLSNVFANDGELESAYSEGASSAQGRWGQMPLMGYESGAALDAARQAGFASIGELAVWVHGGPGV
jgi:hypothetical protein